MSNAVAPAGLAASTARHPAAMPGLTRCLPLKLARRLCADTVAFPFAFAEWLERSSFQVVIKDAAYQGENGNAINCFLFSFEDDSGRRAACAA